MFIDPKNKRMLEEIEKTIGFKIPRESLNFNKNILTIHKNN